MVFNDQGFRFANLICISSYDRLIIGHIQQFQAVEQNRLQTIYSSLSSQVADLASSLTNNFVGSKFTSPLKTAVSGNSGLKTVK